MTSGETTPLLSSYSDESTLENSSDTVHGFRSWNRTKLLIGVALCIQTATVWITSAFITPFFPSEAMKKGASKTEIGIIFGVYSFATFAACPLYGRYANKLGVKYMFISGSFLLGGCTIAFGFLDGCPDGLVFVIMSVLVRAVAGNGCAMLNTASYVIMAKTFPGSIGKALGILETFSGVGFTLGPAIGGALYSLGGFRLPFAVVGVLVLANTVFCFFIVPEIDEATDMVVNFTQLLKISGCVMGFCSLLICNTGNNFRFPSLCPYLQKQMPEMPMSQIGLIFMVVSVAYSVTAPLVGLLCDKGWIVSSTIFGLSMAGICLFLIGPSPIFKDVFSFSLIQICLVSIGIGIANGFVLVPVFPLLLYFAKQAGWKEDMQTLSLISGFYNCAYSLGGFVGPIAGGILDQLYDFPLAASIFGSLDLLMALVFSLYMLVRYLMGLEVTRDTDTEPDGCQLLVAYSDSDDHQLVIAVKLINEEETTTATA